MFLVESPTRFPSFVQAGVVLRGQRIANPKGLSFWPAGIQSPRESELARMLLSHQLGRRPTDLRFLHQVHGDRIVFRSSSETGETPAADAHWTDQPGVVLAANIADCCPVVVCDEYRRAVGVAHSGWRGTTAAIAAQLVETIVHGVAGVSRESLNVWIGPCAEGDRYEVGTDVAVQFERWPEALKTHPSDRKKRLLDVRRVVNSQLIDAGVAPNRIEVSPGGTIGTGMYHSHRRDGFAAGRMIAFATIDRPSG